VIGDVAAGTLNDASSGGRARNTSQPQESNEPQSPGTVSVKLSMLDVFVEVSINGCGEMPTNSGAFGLQGKGIVT